MTYLGQAPLSLAFPLPRVWQPPMPLTGVQAMPNIKSPPINRPEIMILSSDFGSGSAHWIASSWHSISSSNSTRLQVVSTILSRGL
jgi:hypothetical protein